MPTLRGKSSVMNEVELRQQLECAHAESIAWAVTCCRGNRDDADEVLQTVYLSVLDGRARFEGRSTFRTWLFGVIRVTSAAHRRSAWFRALFLERVANHAAPDSAPAADASAEADSRHGRLRAALHGLAKRQREVLQLVFYHDLTVEDAAGVMGVSVGSARTHYARGKENLARRLGRAEDL
jgi:RNA polymerase sigma-70 factor (ECF subfamily)